MREVGLLVCVHVYIRVAAKKEAGAGKRMPQPLSCNSGAQNLFERLNAFLLTRDTYALLAPG